MPDVTSLDAGLPANIDAEKTILGAILLDNAAHSEASERLEPDDFSLDSHKRIFLRMTDLMNAQRAVDVQHRAVQEGLISATEESATKAAPPQPAAASQPACPPPTTMTSYLPAIPRPMFHVKHFHII